ncbi:helix-turn-helix domain-containing protein [Sphingobacterium faecale]|uniref:AraC family transcriptional regulator n=1 Tax=Sphingobacterium faecale TaxID=2803775 RepID=A0ABS1QXX5_9SPHI|nr:helix-turn-helix domain-containing protein [Sphingobacterium faecale]MBL1407144.1 AraC family transcriptional regulator [Sphingobacterium faecale]
MQDIDNLQKSITVGTLHTKAAPFVYQSSLYQILLFDQEAIVQIDFIPYVIPPQSILFLSPYQHLSFTGDITVQTQRLRFHGDYYCIEYHKKEVACNGILFNNIYVQPYVTVPLPLFHQIEEIFLKIENEIKPIYQHSDAIIKAYLQLILALCSKEKKSIMKDFLPLELQDNTLAYQFQRELERAFRQQKTVVYYADQAHLSVDRFSKKIKQQLGKPPSTLIQERTILEAKKMLHLTYLPIKEIAEQLHFHDEHYFSRYFKKHVGISPSQYREQVGISIVAK